MSEHYLTIKAIHMTCAYLTVSFLLFRVFLSVYRPALLQQKWAKVLPHVIDSVLLICAIMMVMVIGPHHPFILAKIILLLAYIGAGYVTLKVVKSTSGKLIGSAVIVLIFVLIVGVAIHKSPLSWWA
ncbi:SirB2 family protein [Pelistega europaea]|uniref:SirB2 family protein n=1 Tax=Pelistega europaea TaxID=106147 RepID=A0A7Y4P5D6_9BURK|nr:SirB2 family protein [Pelistega europaea]NOL49693.1 SirB2 family protein [Pelistega europaea]